MFIAQKRCTFRGKTYCAGAVIPGDVVDPNRIEKLLKYRVISFIPVKAPEGLSDAPDGSDKQTPDNQPGSASNDVKQPLNSAQSAQATQSKAKGGRAARK